MKKIAVRIFFSAVISVGLTSCGGGGGGGSGGSSGSNAANGIRVLHSAIDGAPATLTSSATPATSLATVAYAEQPFYVDLATGAQTISVSQAGDNPSTVSAALNFSGSGRKSVVLVEPFGTQDYSLSVIDDAVPALDSTHSAIQVVHGVGKEGPLTISVNGAALSADIAIGTATPYQAVAAGPVTIVAKRNGGTVYSGTLSLAGGSAYSLLLTGEQGYLVVGKLLAD